jgi:shikimate dehydrogenase
MTMTVSGTTRLAGVIGWPLLYTLSPPMHNAAYEAMGLDWVYIPMPTEDHDSLRRVMSAVRVLPFVGLNVTMPHKEAILELCDEVAMFAQLAGAVNTVHCVDGKLMGYNTDGRGFLASVEAAAGWTPVGKRTIVLGAGGAAAAAAVALMLGGAATVTIANRTLERAESLAARLQPKARETTIDAISTAGEDLAAAVAEADLVVNATPVGMSSEEPSAIPSSWLTPHHVVADMIYRPARTPLIAAAEAAGATAVGGLGMLVEQGAIAIEIWNADPERRAPREVMLAAAQRALGDTTGSEGREDRT